MMAILQRFKPRKSQCNGKWLRIYLHTYYSILRVSNLYLHLLLPPFPADLIGAIIAILRKKKKYRLANLCR